MAMDLPAALCTRCGLCCDGTLLDDVELASEREADGLALLGLEVDEDGLDGAVLRLPCAGLARRRCTVYAYRPEACRTFECRLLGRARAGEVSLKRAQATVRTVLAQIATIECLLEASGARSRAPLKERWRDALARGPGETPRGRQMHDRLRRAVRRLQRTLEQEFLQPLR